MLSLLGEVRVSSGIGSCSMMSRQRGQTTPTTWWAAARSRILSVARLLMLARRLYRYCLNTTRPSLACYSANLVVSINDNLGRRVLGYVPKVRPRSGYHVEGQRDAVYAAAAFGSHVQGFYISVIP